MKPTTRFTSSAVFIFGLALFFAPLISAQSSTVRSLITQSIDETKLVTLRGNTYPLARAEFDRGPVAPAFAMDRMLLVLKRSPEQEAALEKLMAEQQDQSSPNYHKWLTPDEFGKQFGPSDQDIRTVTLWLQSHGFTNVSVSKGRTNIEFSGNAVQVQAAFHTSIHSYLVKGEQHWANAKDPAIPAALSPAVAGVATLHNFFPKPQSHTKKSPVPFRVSANANVPKPETTFSGGPCGLNPANVTNCFGLGPTDFATIYNVLPLWNAGIDGTGQTIAILNDSNINPEDDSQFRSIFGLPPNPPVVIVNGTDPGKLQDGDEVEAILDVEWSGAVAKNATIDLVVSETTSSTFGGDLSATCVVNGTSPCSTTVPQVISESFGQCEAALGTTENSFLNSTWQQAASEGITVLISTGDDGAAGCDQTSATVSPAEFGLQVNGLASTPFDTGVGGTEFNDVTNPTPFWNTSNASGTEASALGYIPEMTYNDTCTSAAVVSFFDDGDAFTACNDLTVQADGFVVTSGGSGGKSTCTTGDGQDVTSCSGGYAKPSWQNALTPADGKRDLPDVSFFSGDSTISGSFYVLCDQDFTSSGSNQPVGNCNLSSGAFLFAGGTSVAAQVMAGVVALIDQKNEDKQGLMNQPLYTLAGTAGKTCTSVASPASTCVFYDVVNTSTLGGAPDTIAMPCDISFDTNTPSPNCLSSGSDPIGILSGYNSGPGYDLATGLGSMNVANLVNAPGVWTNTTGGNDFTISLSSSSVTVSSPGGTGQVNLTVTADGTFNGTVTVACSGLPSETTCSMNPITGSGTNAVMFQTTAASGLTPLKTPNHMGFPGIGTLIFVLCVLSAYILLTPKKKISPRWGIALAIGAFAIAMAGCGGGGNGGGGGGGGNGGTPTGTSQVTITATSGTIVRSEVVTLTVN